MEKNCHTDGTLAPSVHQIDEQIKWEMDTIQMGVERYRRSVVEASLGDTDPGLALLRMILADRPNPDKPTKIQMGLVSAIAAGKDAAIRRSMGAGRARQPATDLLAMFLTPEKIAVIAARTLLTHPRSKDAQGLPVSMLALAITRNIKLEIEYEEWVRNENAKQKADPEYLNIHKLLVSRYRKRVDARVFRRWKRKLRDIQDHEIDPSVALQYGTQIVMLLLEHGGGVFTKRLVKTGNKRTLTIFMSTEAREALYEAHANLEVTRPYLLPMRCPPKPWRRSI